jgi:hypothetical protein
MWTTSLLKKIRHQSQSARTGWEWSPIRKSSGTVFIEGVFYANEPRMNERGGWSRMTSYEQPKFERTSFIQREEFPMKEWIFVAHSSPTHFPTVRKTHSMNIFVSSINMYHFTWECNRKLPVISCETLFHVISPFWVSHVFHWKRIRNQDEKLHLSFSSTKTLPGHLKAVKSRNALFLPLKVVGSTSNQTCRNAQKILPIWSNKKVVFLTGSYSKTRVANKETEKEEKKEKETENTEKKKSSQHFRLRFWS